MTDIKVSVKKIQQHLLAIRFDEPQRLIEIPGRSIAMIDRQRQVRRRLFAQPVQEVQRHRSAMAAAARFGDQAEIHEFPGQAVGHLRRGRHADERHRVVRLIGKWDRLEHALSVHERPARSLAVLFVDLDGFKQVNDSYGHHAGDVLLTGVASRLVAALRSARLRASSLDGKGEP